MIGQRTRNFNAPTFSTGKRDAVGVAQVLYLELFHQMFLHLLAGGFIEVFAQLQNGHYILRYREAAKHRRFLGQVADPEPGAKMHWQVTNGFIIQMDRARVIVDQADDHVKAGGFAGTVGAQ